MLCLHAGGMKPHKRLVDSSGRGATCGTPHVDMCSQRRLVYAAVFPLFLLCVPGLKPAMKRGTELRARLAPVAWLWEYKRTELVVGFQARWSAGWC